MRRFAAVLALAVLVAGCGSNSGGGGQSAGQLGMNAVWQQPQGTSAASAFTRAAAVPPGFTAALPASVTTITAVFQAEALHCCVKINPRDSRLTQSGGDRVVVLNHLPVGSAQVMLAGFPGTTGTAPEGVSTVCATQPAEIGLPCDSEAASPNFQSSLQPVVVSPGIQVDTPFIELFAVGPTTPVPTDTPTPPAATPTQTGISPNTPTFTSTPSGTVSPPATPTNTSTTPTATAVPPGRSVAFVVTDGGVSEIDTATNTIAATLTLSGTSSGLTGVAVTPDGSKVYVTDSDSGAVFVIRTADNSLAPSPINIGVAPGGITVATVQGRVLAYVSPDPFVASSTALAVIDTATDTVSGAVDFSVSPGGVAITPDGTLGYAVAADGSNQVAVFNTATNQPLPNSIAIGGTLESTQIAIAGSFAYVLGAAQIFAINTATNTVATAIPVSDPNFNGFSSGVAYVAASADGRRVYAAGNGGVAVVDTASNTLAAFIAVPATSDFGNDGIALTSDGTRAYLVISGGPSATSQTVSVIDTQNNVVLDVSIPIASDFAGPIAIGNVPGPAANPIITEFPLPTPAAGPLPDPAGITAGPDGNLWFTENDGNKIGRITTSGSLTEFSIPTTDSLPGGITLGADGSLWFTETCGTPCGAEGGRQIGRITPSGVITEFPLPQVPGGPAHAPLFITAGPDGNLWFTETDANLIGRITPDGVISEFSVPTSASFLVGITTGPDGNLWFAEAAANQIGRMTPDGVVTAEFAVPTALGRPLFITAGPDGNLWFTEEDGNQIGRITPGGVVTEFPIATFDSHPAAITAGPDGNLWFTEVCSPSLSVNQQCATVGGNQIGRITPNGAIIEFPVPTANSLPAFITAGPDGNLWFTENAGNKIGRITLGNAATPTPTPIGTTPTPTPSACATDGPPGSIIVFENLQVNDGSDPIVALTNTSQSLVAAYCFYADSSQPACTTVGFNVQLSREGSLAWVASAGAGSAPGTGFPFSGELVCVETDLPGGPLPGNHLIGRSLLSGQCLTPAIALNGFDATDGNATLCLGGTNPTASCPFGAEYDSCLPGIDPARIEGCWSQSSFSFVCGTSGTATPTPTPTSTSATPPPPTPTSAPTLTVVPVTGAAAVSAYAPAAMLVYPYVTVDSANGIDTVVQITNTSISPVALHCFYENTTAHCSNQPAQACAGTGDCPAGGTCVPSWSAQDFTLTLTQGQPGNWRVSQVLGAIPSPPEDPFVGVLRCVTTDSNGVPIANNALNGEATIERFVSGTALDVAKYNAVAVPALTSGNGDNSLLLDGDEYAACPGTIILNGFLDGADDPLRADGTVATRLALVPCSVDYLNAQPSSVIVKYEITNELDQVFTASRGAVSGQLASSLSDIAPIFSSSAAGTATGQIRIRGLADAVHGGGVLGVALEVHQLGATSQSAGLNLNVQGIQSSPDTVVLPPAQ